MPKKKNTILVELDDVLALLDAHVHKWKITARDSKDLLISYKAFTASDAIVDAKIEILEKLFLPSFLKKEK